MTTEDDFQGQLDLHPDDHHTRLVFADWLQDREDVRAEGYRAMGALRKRPLLYPQSSGRQIWGWWRLPSEHGDHLPEDWFEAIPNPADRGSYLRTQPSRREAEDAAAIAFSKLSPERRAQLLQQPVPA